VTKGGKQLKVAKLDRPCTARPERQRLHARRCDKNTRAVPLTQSVDGKMPNMTKGTSEGGHASVLTVPRIGIGEVERLEAVVLEVEGGECDDEFDEVGEGG
jgi:hypothetical protein